VFYNRISLTDDDAQKTWIKRGLIADTRQPLKSNNHSNKEILLSLEKEFKLETLIACGLWVQHERSEPKPNPFYHGWGRKCKKPRTEGDKDNEWEFDWTQPILIPYFDDRGRLLQLRPHKEMLKGRSPHLYVPFPDRQNQRKFDTAIICEGEFKALAVSQVLGDLRKEDGTAAFGVAALPGISMSKSSGGSWWVRAALEKWLRSSGARRVCVAFDNEDKGNPNLPGFKKDPWKRYDTQVWARYLAEQLARDGYDARVCVLPNDWRDENGKADWDGHLSHLLHSDQPAAEPDWLSRKPPIQKVFVEVLKKSHTVSSFRQLGLFSEDEEKTIHRKLRAISYEPKLPRAGDREKWLVRKLTDFVWECRRKQGRIPDAALTYLSWLSRQYRELTEGYYQLKPLPRKDKVPDDANYEQNWRFRREIAHHQHDLDYEWACSIALEGVPEQFTDFYMIPLHILQKESGELRRLVRIFNIHGEKTEVLDLDAESWSAPKQMRVWLNLHANATWGAGEREMQNLQKDMANALAHKSVLEVPYFGWHSRSKLWFFDDLILGDNVELTPDKQTGILWHEGKGYKMADRDHEGEEFKLGRPLMRPDINAKDVWLDAVGGKFESENEAIVDLFQNVSTRLNDALGGYEGYLTLGMMLAYAAAPELYQKFTAFPGLWLHGEKGKGKSSTAKWLQHIWGFTKDVGIVLKGSSRVGICIVLQQYSNLPVWLEEFQTDSPPEIIETIKNSYNREAGIKKTFGEGMRRILGSVVVTGIATSSDAQVRSRFPHIQVSDQKRRVNHFDWFQANCDQFYLLGRHLLRNRPKFVQGVLENLEKWMADPAIESIEQRARYVYGVGYSAMASMVSLLNSHSPTDIKQFHRFTLVECAAGSATVAENVDVNRIWTDIVNALRAGVFGHGRADLSKMFKARRLGESIHPPGVDPHDAHEECVHCFRGIRWVSYRLYFVHGVVLDLLQRHYRQQGKTMSLNHSDLKSQMSQRRSWVNPPNGCVHKQRFGDAPAGSNCWAVDLDFHELGYQPVTDDVMRDSWEKSPGVSWPTGEWVDPRKGELFEIVHAVEPKDGEENLPGTT